MIKKIIKYMTNIVVYGIAGIALVTMIASFAGIKPYITMSGSMEPYIKTGSVCFVNTNEHSEDIGVGDVIAFNAGNGTLVTHRVIDVASDSFKTKGDNNDTPDISPVKHSNFVGKTLFSIPYIGYVIMFFKQPVGFGLMLVLLVVLILSNFIDFSRFKKIQKNI